MADITSIFGGAFSAAAATDAPAAEMPPEEQLRDAIIEAGLDAPDHIQLDGRIHRFNSGTKGKGGHDKTGWYVGYPDNIPAGRFGCWRSGIELAWRANVGRKLSAAEEMAYVRRMREAQDMRDAELAKLRQSVSDSVDSIWQGCGVASDAHPYLTKKGVKSHGVRVTGDGRLVLPVYSDSGELSSLQYISDDGGKLFHPGGAVGGGYFGIGEHSHGQVLYIAEGYATAATIHEVTGNAVIIAFNAGNLPAVAKAWRNRIGSDAIVIVADNDKSGTGAKYAAEAARAVNGSAVMPPIEGMDANDYVQAGHDLMTLLHPPVDEWLMSADEFSAMPSPIEWLVKGWIQKRSLIMVHGASGSGKTFVVLDWLLSIASGVTDWNGAVVKAGAVVYLAGEGHYGLKGRVAAWKQHHNISKTRMWISGSALDLNTVDGIDKTIRSIEALPEPPAVIAIDTLHRFYLGDENSAQDARSMIDACNRLMERFGCTVILVHHTGVSETAQTRARGSSAWKGALDVEINVKQADGAITIMQTKSKDAEITPTLSASLQSVEICGWHDEDGNAVSSAVVAGVTQSTPSKSSGDNKLTEHRRTFEKAWYAAGAEFNSDGCGVLSRSAMMQYLTTQYGLSESSARQRIKPSASGHLINRLLDASMIEATPSGWVVIDSGWNAAIAISAAG